MTKPAKPKTEVTKPTADAPVAAPVLAPISSTQEPAAPAPDAPVAVPDPSFILTGFQLRHALAFLAPDNTNDQLEDGLLLTYSATAGHSGLGVYAQHVECMEEGSVLLTGEGYEVAADPVQPAGPSEVGQQIESVVVRYGALGDSQLQSSPGFMAVLAERVRVIAEKGRTMAMDDYYTNGELVQAAACYAAIAAGGSGIKARQAWPFDLSSFKPGESTRDLIKSAQFLIAELDRRQRAGDPLLNESN